MPIRTFTIRHYDTAVDEELTAFLDRNCNGRYLCVQETAGNRHLHVVFDTEATYEQCVQDAQALARVHPRKKIKASSRNLAHVKEAVDEDYWAYVVKANDPVILFKKGFTEEEIDALHEKSDEHVADLKRAPLDYIRAKFAELERESGASNGGLQAWQLHHDTALFAYRYYKEAGKMEPLNIRHLVRYWLRELFGDRRDVEEYLVGLNL